MNAIDYLIIYLACGAPFGVYYFLQNRAKLSTNKLWLNTSATFVFWIPIAFRLLRENKIKLNTEAILDLTQEKKLNSMQKQFESFLRESSLKISIYEFRETIDRYIGLTFANQNQSEKIIITDEDFFRISKNDNINLAAICLNRRNQKRLSFHHIQARQDFLQFVKNLSECSSNSIEINDLAIDFVETLKDHEAKTLLEKMFAETSQTDKYFIVNQLEKDLWNTEIHKPLPINPISTRLQPLTVTTNLQTKD